MTILNKQFVRKAAGAGLLLVIVAAVTLEATSIIQYFFAKKGIQEEAAMRAESELKTTEARITDIINQAESAVRNNVWIARWCLNYPDSLPMVAYRLMQDNPIVVGSTVALVPGYNKRRPLFSPYALRDGDSISIKSLATQEYDYPSQEWFTKPIETGKGYWSEPYIDDGGGNMLMTTYSVPITDNDGRTAGVLTADISLDWLTELMGNINVYPNAYNMLVSRDGQLMVCPVETLVMHSTIQEIASRDEDSTNMKRINSAMMSGKSGSMEVKLRGVKTSVFFQPVEQTGWFMSIIIPDSEIYGRIKKVGGLVSILQILGILMLIVILWSVIKSQDKYTALSEKKNRMESELKIGSAIQMSMVPKIFPPFPERSDLDMAASIVPAKEVGGDLYDFYINDELLYFCIGDVSGKGVPASLVMAITRTLFRTASAHELSPRNVVSKMNDSMSDMNENNMFVTFFCGILDLKTGHLRYCNAGHNAPLMFTNDIKELEVEPNLPLGIVNGMQFVEQETDMSYDDAIFLYTDGVTEAENINNELYGEDRMMDVLHTRRNAVDQLKTLQESVKEFVGDAPQSDDRTVLFIHYLNKNVTPSSEKHLILHNDIKQISRLSEFMEQIAEENGLDQMLSMNINLAVEEAVTNVILYAYSDKEGLVDIEARKENGALRFVITDSGKPFDPTSVPEADTSLDVSDRPIGGLGVYLVRKLMDSVSYKRTNGKNILTLIKTIE